MIFDEVKFGKTTVAKVNDGDSEFAIEHDLIEALPCGRFLALSQSKKDGGKIAVLGTPITLGLAIVDVDWNSGADCPGSIGFSQTPRGWHFYFPDGAHRIEGADPAYERCSRARGWYAERLFSKDGTPRQVPRVLIAPPSHNALMAAHRDAFIALQDKAQARGLHVPQVQSVECIDD